MKTYQKIQKAEIVDSKDKYVYCLDVADTHNFNANGINVGNCRLISNVEKLGYFDNTNNADNIANEELEKMYNEYISSNKQ